MRFELQAECKFSGELERVKAEIEAAVAGTKPLLLKGAPRGKESEAARIQGWTVRGRVLELKIESGRYVRAHDALLRVAKSLSAMLGRKHRLGLRGIGVPEYRIELPAESPERVKPRLEKLPCEVILGERSVTLILRDLSEADLRGRIVDRLVTMTEEALVPIPPKVPEVKVVKQREPLEHPFKRDPLEVGKRLGWIREFPGRGQWIYAAPYAKLLRALEDVLIELVALPLGFEEMMFPKLISLEVMRRMPGYLDGVPEGMYYVCPPPREPEAFEEFKRQFRLRKRVPSEELKRVIGKPDFVLAPAQCEPFYELFSRRRLRVENLPIKVFDRSGWTYRWEGGGAEGIVRTHEFRRIELTFLGKPSDVVKIRDAVRDRGVEVADELGLEWRLCVATPFYMREGGIEEEPGESAGVATYDLEARLPYKDGWTELGSFNVHRTKFIETFKVREVKGRELWTGCCGFGSTRWVVSFLAQHGFDPKAWPKWVRKRVEPLPGALREGE